MGGLKEQLHTVSITFFWLSEQQEATFRLWPFGPMQEGGGGGDVTTRAYKVD